MIEVKFIPTSDNAADIFTNAGIDAATVNKHLSTVMNK